LAALFTLQTTTMQTTPLAGDALALSLAINHTSTRADQARAAGYGKPDGKVRWTDFYEAKLGAGYGLAMDYHAWQNVARCAQNRSRAAYGAEEAAREDLSALTALRLARSADIQPAAVVDSIPDEIGVYVACLASYNAGRLYGCWVDLEYIDDAEELQEAIDWIIRQSPAWDAEEYAIHDNTGLPGFLARTEWPGISELAEYAANLGEVGADNAEPYRLLCENLSTVVDPEDFRSAYMGQYDDGPDFCVAMADEQGIDYSGAAWPFCHIDWEAAWRDYETSGDYVEIEPARGCGVSYFFRGV
jgi:antirestriction protein